MEAWSAAFSARAIDPAFYTHRPRRSDEVFPWEHISDAVRKKYLYRDYQLSLECQTHLYCREDCDACGILPTFAARATRVSRPLLEVSGSKISAETHTNYRITRNRALTL